MTLTSPLWGIFFIGMLGLATVNICTKFKVPACSRYEDMNGDAKCKKNWGSLGQLEVTQGHPQYDFLFDFNRNHASCTVFEI